MKNPYLEEATKLNFGMMARESLIATYGYAIPDERAIHKIAEYAPIIEIGAGTGYWASLLKQVDADVVAYDKDPVPTGRSHFGFTTEHFLVEEGTIDKLEKHPNRTLFICWPNYNSSFAYDCLRAYEGDTFIYIGESEGGCTGDNNFFRLLTADWKLKESMRIPQWIGLHDRLYIFVRDHVDEGNLSRS